MILRNSVNAALQRAHVYKGSANAKIRENIRKRAKEWLADFGNRYSWKKTNEENWSKEVESLADMLTREYGEYLTGKRLRIGVSQKMISLYLKYLWLLGNKEKKPLFAVLDRGIMKAAHIMNPPNWTELDCINEYKRVVCKICEFAQSQTSEMTGKLFSDGVELEAEKWPFKADGGDASI